MNSITKLENRMKKSQSLVCVGLDSDMEKLPERFLESKYPQFEFNKRIIEETHEYVCAYKPNVAFYEARGAKGWEELQMTMDYLKENHGDIFTICDAKRADIGNTNRGYVQAIFDELGFDAVTLHPFLGREALTPFLEREDKVLIVLCRTSNPGAGEFQDLEVGGKPMWQMVAESVRDEWNKKDNCMLVVGATYPDELGKMRELCPKMTFLVPGVGAQGGDVKKTIKAGKNKYGRGMIVNSSRGVIFAQDPGKVARELRDEINKQKAESREQ